MFKKMAISLAFGLSAFSTVLGLKSDYITYDWLMTMAKETSYTDHIPHWRRLFNTMKVRGFIECGCGYSTKYFLDNAEKVISIEYVSPGYGPDWYKELSVLLEDCSNWIGMTYNEDLRSNSFNNSCAYQCCMHKDYALIDPTYLTELNEHFKSLIENAHLNGYDIDVAFVDPGVYLRGDLVKLLLANKIPVIVAHDTASDAGIKEKTNLYGWNKVVTPPDYVKIYIPFGQGTTFWINKQLPTVIASMIGYRDTILQLREEGVNVGYDDLSTIADMP